MKSFKAESLIETIIAVTVVVLTSSAAMGLTRMSVTGNEAVRNKMLATDLAQEAIEAVKNIRDTNYLRYASDPTECWYVYGFKTSAAAKAENCSTSSAYRIDEGTYYLIRDLTTDYFEWSLDTSVAKGAIYKYTMTGDGDILYAQKGIKGYDSYGVAEDTGYTRTLTVTNKTTATDGSVAGFDVNATVSWTSKGVDESVSFTRRIKNVY